MTQVSAFLDAYSGCYTALTSDLTTCLALTGAWLDPVPMHPDEVYDDEELRLFARMRELFVDQYAGYHWLRYEGAPSPHADMRITQEINALLPCGEMWELDELCYSPPLEYLGAGIGDENFWEVSRGADIARLFLLDDDTPDRYVGHAHAILRDGIQETQPDLSMVVCWLFGSSGNTLFDLSPDEGAESGMMPPEWEELDAVREVYEEASEFFGQTLAGLSALETDDALYADFCGNLLIAYCHSVQEEHFDHRDICPAFIWSSGRRESAAGATDPSDQLHALRDSAA